jgi:hypothetical protein
MKKKTKFEEVAVFLFPLVCVRHQVLGRFPPLVSIPSVLKFERPYFFCFYFWQWSSITIQNTDGSDGRRGRASASHISLRSFFCFLFPGYACVLY